MASRGRRLQSYHELSNFRAGLDLVLHVGALLAIFALCHALQHPLAYLVGIVLVGGLQNAFASLSHEAWHQKTFTWRPLNELVGAWVYSYPIGLPFHHDRRRHLQHHQRVGLETDPDWPNYGGDAYGTAPRVLGFLLGKVVGLHLVGALWQTVVKRRPRIDVGESNLGRGPSAERELASVLAMQGVLFVGFALFAHWWEYFVLWVLPLATVTAFLVSTRAYLEHAYVGEAQAPEDRLYDFDTNAIGHFFLSPCHFHLHALHHAHPGVPHYRVPALKRELATAEGLGYAGEQKPGYLRVLVDNLRALRAA